HALGPEAAAALPQLLALARAGDHDTSLAALQAIIAIDPDHEQLPPLLGRRLLDEPELVHNLWQWAAELGVQAPGIVAEVMRRLDVSAETKQRVIWMQVLGVFGPDARQAAPMLLRLAETEEEDCRHAAIRALGNIASADERVVPWLIQLLRQEKSVSDAIDALAQFGNRAESAVPYLLPYLK